MLKLHIRPKVNACSVCPRSLDSFYLLSYHIKLLKTFWAYNTWFLPLYRMSAKSFPFLYGVYTVGPRRLYPICIN